VHDGPSSECVGSRVAAGVRKAGAASMHFFPLPPGLPFHIGFWIVAVHGLTDLWTHRALCTCYVACARTWPLTRAIFTVASAAHFGRDLGFSGSVGLHAAAYALWWSLDAPAVGYTLVLLHLLLKHVPDHLARAHPTPVAKVALGAIAVLGTACTPPQPRLTPFMQRVASVHAGLHLLRPLPEPLPGPLPLPAPLLCGSRG